MAAVARKEELEPLAPALESAPPADIPRFDRVARLYQAMEYLSFGRMLERCRFHHTLSLSNCRRALILGDGDGRFLAQLLVAAPDLSADAVDASPAMLQMLRARAEKAGAANRVCTICANARCFTPRNGPYDLVATHFFLDCLTEEEAHRLIARVRPHLAPGAHWMVSEFQVPEGSWLRSALAQIIIDGLYAAFRVLTGLRVRRIPPWRVLLAKHGFRRTASQTWLGSLLVSELWEPNASNHRGDAALPPGVNPNNDTRLDAGSIPGIDPGPQPFPDPPPAPTPDPAPGPAPEPDPEPYPGPIPAPQPVTRQSAS